MSKLPTFLSAFDKLLTGHPIYFTNSLLVVLSAGGEKFFQSVAFKCPKDPELAWYYGWLFLIAPLFVLLICGIVLSDGLWRVYHGCQKRSAGTQLNWGDCRFCATFFRSLIVPSAWLIVSLLDGTYVVCIWADEPDQDTEKTQRIKAFSQMFGWGVLVLVIVVGTSVTCYLRCCDAKTFQELRYAQVYKKKEKEELEKQMNEKAQKIAEANVKSLFSEDLPPKETWDQVTVPVSIKDSDAKYYSSLHKWNDQGIDKKPKGASDDTKNRQPTEATDSGAANGSGD